MVLKHLSALSEALAQHSDILRATNVYPMPSFPVTKQPGLLPTLLRKKVEPEIEEWIDEGVRVAEEKFGIGLGSGKEAERAVTRSRMINEELWEFAATVVVKARDSRAWDGLMTGSEIMELRRRTGGIAIPSSASSTPVESPGPSTLATSPSSTSPSSSSSVTSSLQNTNSTMDMEASLEQVLRYIYQGIDIHEPVRKVPLTGPNSRLSSVPGRR
ncbi:mediator complex, subunit Med8 [Lipomyces oligophaga]|uniref:mediator complex, subunit Med8 n=1 Tax=Lipomyces oligophaga TaxID=45792 RepID=UPI0034CF7C3D